MPAKAAKVPITAWMTMPPPNWYSKNLLNAPSATPSAAQKSSTNAGLITRLKELTIDSPNAVRPPIVIAAYSCEMAFCESVPFSVMAGVTTHVANAVTITTRSARPVFCTTLSIVIGRVSACRP